MSPPGRRIGWTLRQRGGLPLALAVLATLGTLVFEVWLTPLWREQARSAQAQAQSLQRAARDSGLRKPASAAAPVPAALPALPSADAAPSRMADLLALALQYRVQVLSLQRAGSPAGAGRAQQTVLVMPVRATYADLRRFVSQALQDDAALALTRVSVRRTKPDTAELEGELQWALLQRDARTATP
jgi:hypothetical protein